MNDSIETVIEVKDLSKKFAKNIKRSMLYGTVDLFKNLIGKKANRGNLRESEFWALQDINFSVKKGETLGIIGPNGSGKSTLLRLLTGIFPPDKGFIKMDGRVGALIAVGAGFHPHMTGRENIYLNGIILGMTQEEIDRKYQEIVDFADIGDFLESPVSTYSSGMKVRLGFSIAVHSEAEILLVDEILSVGDLAFRNKSLNKMYELRKKIKGIIFISHNIEHVLNICDRIIVMDKGRIIFDGNPNDAVVKYYEVTNDMKHGTMDKETAKLRLSGKHRVLGGIDLNGAGIHDEEGNVVHEVGSKDDINLFYDLTVKVPIKNARFAAVIRNEFEKDVVWVENLDHQIRFTNIEPGNYRLKVKVKNHNLVPNVYKMGISISESESMELFIQSQNYTTFKIKSDKNLVPRGIVWVDDAWELEQLGTN